MPRLLGLLLLLATLAGSVLLAQEPNKEPELTKEERAKLLVVVNRLIAEGNAYHEAARYSEAEKTLRQVLPYGRQLYPPSQFPNGHPFLATTLGNLAFLLKAQNQLTQAESLDREALAMWQKLYPPARYPQGHRDLALSMQSLASLLQAQGQLDQAEPLFRQALAMYHKLYPAARFPQGHPDLAASLNYLAFLLQAQGRLTQAEPLFRDSLEMNRKLYPPARFYHGHPHLAHCLNNLAGLLQAQHQLAQAEPLFREALAIREKLYPIDRFPQGHPDLANSLDNLAVLLHVQGQSAQAEPLFRNALAMRQKLYPAARFPQGHRELASSLSHLATLLQDQGQLTRAEPLCRQALAMYHKLYPAAHFPQGHPELASSLDNLASLLHAQGQSAQAEPLLRQALAMREKLYPAARFPQGHPELASSLSHLATLLHDQGQTAQAQPLCRQALAMREKLYPAARFPQGHPHLANSLSNLAMQLLVQGQLTQAEPLCRQALAMYHKLYPADRFPQGHWDLALSLLALALLLHAQGQPIQAEPLSRDAMAMCRRLAVAYAEVRGEGEVLMLTTKQQLVQHLYLTLLHQQPGLATRGYASLWDGRSYLARLAEQKRLAVRAAAVSPQFRQQWAELSSLKQQRAQLLLAPEVRDPETAQVREKLLTDWGRKIHDLAALTREGMPALRELQRLENSTPAALQEVLPAKAVFVDLLWYILVDADPTKLGQVKANHSLRYVAFVVAKEGIQYVELGPSESLDALMRQWRHSLTTKNVVPDRTTPATLRRLLWEPLETHFPPVTTTVYLCPDQMLCFLPWGALPGKKAETVLLEDYTLAIVPHGPYLLGQLLGTKDKEKKTLDLLVLGGVKYDDTPVQALPVQDRGQDDPKAAPVQAVKGGWRYLPGTAQEAATIQALADKQKLRTHRLADMQAGTERFKQELPKARIAHLATHGFFADPKFRSVLQLDEKHFAMRGQERVGAGALLPSLLSGLVFAGANRPETPGRGIVTAEELFDLDLTSMELAVLSACETGLGEVGGGEGVFGLQRAFHVAGCQNVIASLWKVNDVATMVLMEEFYRNFWEKKLTKREALRQAQLMVYRNPDLVLKRAQKMGVRGIEDEAVPLPAGGPGAPRRSPPAWWAAFQISGLGE